MKVGANMACCGSRRCPKEPAKRPPILSPVLPVEMILAATRSVQEALLSNTAALE